MKVTLNQPTPKSAQIAVGRFGASAVAATATPKPKAASVSGRNPVFPRAATTSPPTTAPTPIADVMKPRACGPPSNTKSAAAGSVTGKLYVRVPTSAIVASGIHSAGRLRTYRRPSRS